LLQFSNYCPTVSSALQLLDSLLSASSARKDSAAPKPAFIPPPSQISLLSTLAIHPSHTSCSKEPGELQISSHALQYLRSLCATVGPVNANLRAAFEFQSGSLRNARRGWLIHDVDRDSDHDEDRIDGKFANELGLWSNSPDFWVTLGWAFHCSVTYPHRWRYWKAWLECILEIMEADWYERLRLDQRRQETCPGEDVEFPSLQESILMMYVNSLRRERKAPLREILRALFAFADGTVVDGAVYKEVFGNETLTPSKNKRKRAQTLDLDQDQFGDYLDDDDCFSSQNEEPSTPTKPRPRRRGKPRKTDNPAPRVASPGLAESVQIRLRLFDLLSAACHYLPDPFAPLHELYDAFATSVRGLPLDMFRLFVESHTTPLGNEVYISLLRYIIDKLLPTTPDPGSVDPATNDTDGVSVAILEHCFLPFAANKIFVEDNAKLSLILEHMVRSVWNNSHIEYSPTFRQAVERGIEARNEKTRPRKNGRPKATSPAEDATRQVLDNSSHNLNILLDLVEMSDC